MFSISTIVIIGAVLAVVSVVVGVVLAIVLGSK